MKLADIVDIEEATSKISEMTSGINHKPIILGIYGIPNHGKSYFMKKFQENLYDSNNPYAIRFSNGPESLPYFDKSSCYLIAVPRGNINNLDVRRENLIIKHIIGREFDLNILIFNPLFYMINAEKCRKKYDLIIVNSNSKHKKI